MQDEIEKALKDSMFKKLKERAQKLKELDGKEHFYPKHAIQNASLVGAISERCFLQTSQ